MTGHEKRQFHGTGSAKPQNITGLALNEMWGLYGYDVSIASIVNDGPGRPDEVSVRSMTQCFKSMFENDPPTYEQWKSCTRNKGTEAAKCSRINREEIAMEMLQDELDESVWRRLNRGLLSSQHSVLPSFRTSLLVSCSRAERF